MNAPNVMKPKLRRTAPGRRSDTKLKDKSLRSQFATSNKVYVTLTSVYVPYTCRKASQISPTVA